MRRSELSAGRSYARSGIRDACRHPLPLQSARAKLPPHSSALMRGQSGTASKSAVSDRIHKTHAMPSFAMRMLPRKPWATVRSYRTKRHKSCVPRQHLADVVQPDVRLRHLSPVPTRFVRQRARSASSFPVRASSRSDWSRDRVFTPSGCASSNWRSALERLSHRHSETLRPGRRFGPPDGARSCQFVENHAARAHGGVDDALSTLKCGPSGHRGQGEIHKTTTPPLVCVGGRSAFGQVPRIVNPDVIASSLFGLESFADGSVEAEDPRPKPAEATSARDSAVSGCSRPEHTLALWTALGQRRRAHVGSPLASAGSSSAQRQSPSANESGF